MARPRLPYEIEPGIFALDRFGGAWCYLLTGDTTLLVDTGFPGRAGALERAIERCGLAAASVDRIVLTHFDMDHAGSARRLSDRLDAPVAIHHDDAPYLAAPEACPGVRSALYWPWITWALRWRPPEANELLSDGADLDGWRVMHTPGHTPGSISLIRDGVAIVGDALVCRRNRLRPNVPWLAVDLAAQRRSMQALIDTHARLVLPGHYMPCTDPNALAALGRRISA